MKYPPPTGLSPGKGHYLGRWQKLEEVVPSWNQVTGKHTFGGQILFPAPSSFCASSSWPQKKWVTLLYHSLWPQYSASSWPPNNRARQPWSGTSNTMRQNKSFQIVNKFLYICHSNEKLANQDANLFSSLTMLTEPHFMANVSLLCDLLLSILVAL